MEIYIIFLLLHSILSSSTNVSGNEIDKLALLAFKSQLTENPQNALTSWNDTLPACQWEGITCGRRHQRVVILDLESKGLGGTISPHIGNLTFLRVIELYNNSFHGNIPGELGRLFRLKSLSLGINSLVGEIPGNISHCSNLKFLFLVYNNLVGKMPMELGSLSKLTQLVLHSNRLSGGIPTSLANLTSLQAIDLSMNDFGGNIPSTFHLLRNLRYLSLNMCNLSGEFPPNLYNNLSTITNISIVGNQLRGEFHSETVINLPNLKEFLLGRNQFSGHIPTSLFNSSSLARIDISNNLFTGKVTENVGSLINLMVFNIGNNHLGHGKIGDLDFLNSLSNCSSLLYVELNSNNFGGVLPASIGNFSSIEKLFLSTNQISGSIPREIGSAKSVMGLYMQDNFFSGSIPMEIGNLHNLQELSLGNNQLSGQVPSSLRKITKLYFLELTNNSLGGSISSTLENPSLQFVYLSHNYLTGNLVKPKTRLSSHLIELDVSYNDISGSIPLEIGTLKNLHALILSHNNFSGEIPSTIGSCLSLEKLELEGNSFHGPIPTFLSSIKVLQYLDLSSNNFFGEIPKEMETLQLLAYLNLSYNRLEGEVPVKGVFKNSSAFSIFGNNKTCGGVSQLKLPKCQVLKSKRHPSTLSLKVILGVSISLFLLALFLVIYWWKKKAKANPLAEPQTVVLRRVSYIDLHKATEGFSIVNLIGTGSYGSVYKGTLQLDEGLVAVKVFNLMEGGASKSFLRECEALREIRHRNLLKIFTVCSSEDFNGNDFKALVFEFMTNGSLDNWLHPSSILPRSLDFLQRLTIAIDVASPLNYLHNDLERPIVHCDVKASNILLDEDMTACVGDFGLTKFLSKSNNNFIDSESSSIAVRGTIGYIPPEYGMGAEVSKQGDMYSYGILLLEMITGKRPTDQMFKDGLSLREFCKAALPDQVLEIIDMGLSHEAIDDTSPTSLNLIKECFNAIIEIGVACSMKQVEARMNIKQALKELHSIKKALLSLPSKEQTFTQ